MHPGRTLLRYLAGAVVVAMLIAGGSALRIVQFAHAAAPSSADAILVLGAAQYNGTPSPVFAARLDHARDLYRAGLAEHIITVGAGQQGDVTTEAEAGKRYLVADGIPAGAIVAVPRGNDTLVSVRAAARKALRSGWGSVIVVSDPWHVARVRMIARDAGLIAQVSPVDSGPATDRSVEARYLERELLGVLYYRLVGGSSGTGAAVL